MSVFDPDPAAAPGHDVRSKLPASLCVCLRCSLKNRPPQQSEQRQSTTSGYRSDYDQYQQQYQQQAYPGYYSSWGYDASQTPGAYAYNYQNYDYSQYAVPQVGGAVSCTGLVQVSVVVANLAVVSLCSFGGRKPKPIRMMVLKVWNCTSLLEINSVELAS